MNLWTSWLDALRALVGFLSTEVGLGLGVAIIVTTVLVRALLLPISWRIAYRGSIRQKKIAHLQPELQRLQQKHANDPRVYLEKVKELYRANDLSFFDGKSLTGGLLQAPLLLGMFQALRTMGNGVRFLWVPNLLKPDVVLALAAGIATALMMAANPDLPEHARTWMIVVPAIITIYFALKVCSALSLYWVATNGFSALQTMVLRSVVARRLRAGTLKI